MHSSLSSEEDTSPSPTSEPFEEASIKAPTVPPGSDAHPTIDPPERAGSSQQTQPTLPQSAWIAWYRALQQVLPIYLATHIAFIILTYLSVLFRVDNFATKTIKMSILLQSWNEWDSGQYIGIAQKGYDFPYRAAFFPLYPLLERSLTFLTRDPFVAGLIISNLTGLVMLVVLYRLVLEDFDAERAFRTVLYLSIFPTAFFFATAYNESLFLCLSLLSFYSIRRGQWWLAGLFGLLASLTRSAGVLLLLPFCYEYLRQRHFRLKMFRFNALGGALIPAGLGLFSLYCYFQFHDALAFSHAQTTWDRHLHAPWHGLINTFQFITQRSTLNFFTIHNVIDFSAGIFMLSLLLLCFIGPWRLPRDRWAYGLYAIFMALLFLLFPVTGTTPLVSLPRFVLELFPLFIVLAAMGKNASFNIYYLTISTTLLAFMLLQFTIGRWIV